MHYRGWILGLGDRFYDLRREHRLINCFTASQMHVGTKRPEWLQLRAKKPNEIK